MRIFGNEGIGGAKITAASFMVTWLVIVALSVGCLYLATDVYTLKRDVKSLDYRLKLARVLSPGRTRAEVIQWLGKPDAVHRNLVVGGRKVAAAMVYKSVGFYSTRMNGPDDIWVMVDASNHIMTVYYPDTPQDRANLDRGK